MLTQKLWGRGGEGQSLGSCDFNKLLSGFGIH